MKQIIFLSIALFPLLVNAQNVGINNPNPTEKLDVNGNVNVTGTIKANGTQGTPGQVLMSTGSGLSWGSLAGYKKCVAFYNGTGTWTVPAGVTEVMVELWGAGSGGTSNCGGTSGGYARTIQNVSPGYNISYTIGLGTTYGSASTTAGGFTQATLPNGYIRAHGGGGVNATQVGVPSSGSTFLSDNFFFMHGNSGTFNTYTQGQKSATVFVQTIQYGSGGAPVGLLNSSPVHGDWQLTENGTLINFQSAFSSNVPGAGGCAGSGSGWAGANGMILFWFN